MINFGGRKEQVESIMEKESIIPISSKNVQFAQDIIK
jgi:hypothetical protein